MRLIDYMKRKEKAFRIIDTHAGIGLYDLSSSEAQKTGEWNDGIGKLISLSNADMPGAVADYLDLVRGENNEKFQYYPGSPLIAHKLLRKQDRLTLIELHREDYQTLSAKFMGDYQVKCIHLDGWLALGSFVPPKEKRGLVLIDPPYEKRNDFETMVGQLQKAMKRWPGGTYALWYPLKDRDAVTDFKNQLSTANLGEVDVVEMDILDSNGIDGLFGNGMAIVNPPYILKDELGDLLPYLVEHLAQAKSATYRIETL